jgi:hypothetical protein
MRSAGESLLLVAVSSWTVGSGVIPEHWRSPTFVHLTRNPVPPIGAYKASTAPRPSTHPGPLIVPVNSTLGA